MNVCLGIFAGWMNNKFTFTTIKTSGQLLVMMMNVIDMMILPADFALTRAKRCAHKIQKPNANVSYDEILPAN